MTIDNRYFPPYWQNYIHNCFVTLSDNEDVQQRDAKLVHKCNCTAIFTFTMNKSLWGRCK